LPHEQIDKIIEISKNVSLGSLAKIWQMLLKGTNEINYAPNAKVAMEMLLIRVCHASTMPSVKDLIAKIKSNSENAQNNSVGSAGVELKISNIETRGLKTQKESGQFQDMEEEGVQSFQLGVDASEESDSDQNEVADGGDLINDIFNQFPGAKVIK
jgi:DNA polymerase III gamma/tau subunit